MSLEDINGIKMSLEYITEEWIPKLNGFRLDRTFPGSRIHNSLQMLGRRELGLTMFQNDVLGSKYYRYISVKGWLTEPDKSRAEHGGIFNLEFSPSGKMVAAACEHNAILLLDPVSRKLVSKIEEAHNDCVNCICFLGDRMFASGSDDNSIALWDARMLSSHVTKLAGHSNWVKNIAYHSSSNQLVSSSYDGTCRSWDINLYSNGDIKSTVICTINNLSRMQLTPGSDKLIISTFAGELMIFHNLELQTLTDDIIKEKLAMRGLGVRSQQSDRNHREMIIDFPYPPLYISSIQVHPYGWCVMSRYTGRQLVEYTAIHDIQSIPNGMNTSDFTSNRQDKGVCNVKRLSHFVEESNSAKGIIKESHFSNDGRIIASPFGHGTRLLAFTPDCCELSDCDHGNPVTAQLHEVKYLVSHRRAVCTSKFSPTHMMLATGCLGGMVVFHEPYL